MGLLDFFRRKSSPPPTMPAEEQAAYEKGRRLGKAYADAMTAYVGARSVTIQQNFLEVFQKTLDEARQQAEHSPILMARAEYSVFQKQVPIAIAELVDETHSVMSDWNELHKAMDMADFVRESIEKHVSDQLGNLSIQALEVMMQNADILKTADQRWRVKYPDLAALEPLD